MEKQTDSKNFTKTSAFGECLWKGLIYVLLIIWAGIVLFPFYWMVLTSLKSYGSYNAEHIPAFFTASPTLEDVYKRQEQFLCFRSDVHSFPSIGDAAAFYNLNVAVIGEVITNAVVNRKKQFYTLLLSFLHHAQCIILSLIHI